MSDPTDIPFSGDTSGVAQSLLLKWRAQVKIAAVHFHRKAQWLRLLGLGTSCLLLLLNTTAAFLLGPGQNDPDPAESGGQYSPSFVLSGVAAALSGMKLLFQFESRGEACRLKYESFQKLVNRFDELFDNPFEVEGNRMDDWMDWYADFQEAGGIPEAVLGENPRTQVLPSATSDLASNNPPTALERMLGALKKPPAPESNLTRSHQVAWSKPKPLRHPLVPPPLQEGPSVLSSFLSIERPSR